ncbi:MAG: TRAP transporter small permease subunit [Hyphococcus sp.]
MLTLAGDTLNWLAAGVLFPLMLLPLAALAGGRRQSVMWFALLSALTGAGVLFARMTPVLSATPHLHTVIFFTLTALATLATAALTGGPAAWVPRLQIVFEQITRGAARAVMWLLLAMALVQFGVVVLRYVFGVNFIFMQESITYMHGAVFLVASGYALLTDGHVRVDIFYRDASPRRKAFIDFLGTYLLLFPVCLLLLWAASPYVGASWAVREGSTETSGIQAVFLLKSLIPVFSVLLAMAGFIIAARAGETLKGRSA